jgi:hypothetical protein
VFVVDQTLTKEVDHRQDVVKQTQEVVEQTQEVVKHTQEVVVQTQEVDLLLSANTDYTPSGILEPSWKNVLQPPQSLDTDESVHETFDEASKFDVKYIPSKGDTRRVVSDSELIKTHSDSDGSSDDDDSEDETGVQLISNRPLVESSNPDKTYVKETPSSIEDVPIHDRTVLEIEESESESESNSEEDSDDSSIEGSKERYVGGFNLSGITDSDQVSVYL